MSASSMSPKTQKNHKRISVKKDSFLEDVDLPFSDNFEHLQALEFEATVLLISASRRAFNVDVRGDLGDKNPLTRKGKTPKISETERRYPPEQILAETRRINRKREALSESAGVSLHFEKICQRYGLDDFERDVVLVLFMKSTAEEFATLLSNLESRRDQPSVRGLRVGTILLMLNSEFVDQIRNRKYFSTNATLMRNEILANRSSQYDDISSILDEEFFLHQRVVNYILGDNNVYGSELKCINKVNPSVNIDQVVIPEQQKRQILQQAQKFLGFNERGHSERLNKFFGYGTGLTYLFYGPSGTGKTMMAHSLANKLNSTLLGINLEKLDRWTSTRESVIAYLFKEAQLTGGIVFLDECDDMFETDSCLSMFLLTELEKACCITIMATNRPERLDKAIDRRIALKVPFHVPSEQEREVIWKALLPPQVKAGSGLDFKCLAEKYVFTGGLIKNTILMALHKATDSNNGKDLTLSQEDLEKAAEYQAENLLVKPGCGKTYKPSKKAGDLPLGSKDRGAVQNLAKCTGTLVKKGSGARIVLTADDIQTGIDVVDSIGASCGLYVRRVDVEELSRGTGERDRENLFRSEKFLPLDFMTMGPGPRFIICLVDRNGHIEDIFTKHASGEDESQELLSSLRSSEEVIYIVTRPFKSQFLPQEITLFMNISPPPEEIQLNRWQKVLNGCVYDEKDLVDLVERYPMHIREIDSLAHKARLSSLLHTGDESQAFQQIERVIRQHRSSTPVLFGTRE